MSDTSNNSDTSDNAWLDMLEQVPHDVRLKRLEEGCCVLCGSSLVPVLWTDGTGKDWPLDTHKRRMVKPVMLVTVCEAKSTAHPYVSIGIGSKAYVNLRDRDGRWALFRAERA